MTRTKYCFPPKKNSGTNISLGVVLRDHEISLLQVEDA
jgi:hypothetical protein